MNLQKKKRRKIIEIITTFNLYTVIRGSCGMRTRNSILNDNQDQLQPNDVDEQNPSLHFKIKFNWSWDSITLLDYNIVVIHSININHFHPIIQRTLKKITIKYNVRTL